MTQGERLACGSIGLGCAVLALKTVAWWLTGSAALYSDALESIVNVAAATVAVAALRFAARPADANHPYGHDKAEFFAAVVEGVMIVIAALSIFNEARLAWREPRVFSFATEGLALSAVATAVNGVWAWILIRAGKRLRSAVLAGDGRHLVSDVVTSVGVAAGFGLAVLTGYQKLDPLLAFATGGYVLWSGANLIRTSISGLMDMAPAADVLGRIDAVIAESGGGGVAVHKLRARQAGRLTFLDFHLAVPGTMSVNDAHAICDRIETALKAEMDHLAITIHIEPDDEARRQARGGSDR